MESVHKAVQHNLINPTFVGNKNEIKKYADKLKWDITKYNIIDEKDENNTAPIAAKLASEDKVKIIVKGHIHTDVLMKAVLKRDLNLIGKKRLSHVWHMTLSTDDKPFIITDGVVNVLPKLEVKMHILRNAVDFANKIGISRPKVSVLSATEEVIESVPSSIEANLIAKKAKEYEKIAGIHNGTTQYAKEMIAIGYQLVTVSSDYRAMTSFAQSVVDEMKQLTRKTNQSDTY